MNHAELAGSSTQAEALAASQRAGVVLRTLIAGTSSVTGLEFFRALVMQLCTALDVRYAFVAECLPNLRARSRAYWIGERFGDDFEYDLPGTPCLEVAQ